MARARPPSSACWLACSSRVRRGAGGRGAGARGWAACLHDLYSPTTPTPFNRQRAGGGAGRVLSQLQAAEDLAQV